MWISISLSAHKFCKKISFSRALISLCEEVAFPFAARVRVKEVMKMLHKVNILSPPMAPGFLVWPELLEVP